MDSNASLKPSLHFAVWLLLLHGIVAIILCKTLLPLPVKSVILLLTCLSLIYYFLRDVLLLFPNSWRELELNKNGISVISQGGPNLIGRVENKTVVSPYFILLWVKIEGRRLPVSRVIFRDAMSKEAFREFCVRLKFAC